MGYLRVSNANCEMICQSSIAVSQWIVSITLSSWILVLTICKTMSSGIARVSHRKTEQMHRRKQVKVALKPTASKRLPSSFSCTSIQKEKREQLEVGQSCIAGSRQQFTGTLHEVPRREWHFFMVVNSPFFLDSIGSLNVSYTPAGRDHSHPPPCSVVSALDCSSTCNDSKLRR